MESVEIVDDNAESRTGFGYTVEDANLEPRLISGPLGSLVEFAKSHARADVLLSDYELRAKNYAQFNGAELVALRQRSGQPSILCTKYERAQVERIRPHRRWIPALLAPNDLNPDSLQQAITKCRQELKGDFSADRKPWRALVRFIEQDPEVEGRFFVELPSWDLRERVPVSASDLPKSLVEVLRPNLRCHAMVNLASERYEDLFFESWTLP